MNRYSRCSSEALRTIVLAAVITVLGLSGTPSVSSAQADSSTGTSQNLCGSGGNGPVIIRVAGSQAISTLHFTLLENQPGTMGAATAGNLVFAVDNGARLRHLQNARRLGPGCRPDLHQKQQRQMQRQRQHHGQDQPRLDRAYLGKIERFRFSGKHAPEYNPGTASFV